MCILATSHQHFCDWLETRDPSFLGSFEGTLYLRQRYGNVAVHIGGPCQLLEIDVAEGDIELSLPVSTVGSKLSGCAELQASQIEIGRDTLPIDCLDNREFGEVAEAQTFSGQASSHTILKIRIIPQPYLVLFSIFQLTSTNLMLIVKRSGERGLCVGASS